MSFSALFEFRPPVVTVSTNGKKLKTTTKRLGPLIKRNSFNIPTGMFDAFSLFRSKSNGIDDLPVFISNQMQSNHIRIDWVDKRRASRNQRYAT